MNDKLMKRLEDGLQRSVRGDYAETSMLLEDTIQEFKMQPMVVNEFMIHSRLQELYPYADIKYISELGIHVVLLCVNGNELWRCTFGAHKMKWIHGNTYFETMQELESAFALFIQSIGTQLERAK